MRTNIIIPIDIFHGKLIHHLHTWKWGYIKKVTFKSVIKSFHWSIIIRTTGLTHALGYIIIFTEIHKITWGKLYSLIWMQNHYRIVFYSNKSIIEQLYLNFPFGWRIYVKSVHHTLFLQSTIKFWLKRLSKIFSFSQPCIPVWNAWLRHINLILYSCIYAWCYCLIHSHKYWWKCS